MTEDQQRELAAQLRRLNRGLDLIVHFAVYILALMAALYFLPNTMEKSGFSEPWAFGMNVLVFGSMAGFYTRLFERR